MYRHDHRTLRIPAIPLPDAPITYPPAEEPLPERPEHEPAPQEPAPVPAAPEPEPVGVGAGQGTRDTCSLAA